MTATQIFPALDPLTEAALRASIKRFGVLVPVVKDQDGRILDGHHRVRIADELGLDCYEEDVKHVADEEEALEIARTLNTDRRHLTIEQRQEVAVALRETGHSLRAIAGALGTSKTTVKRDLSRKLPRVRPLPGVPGGTPDLSESPEPPERIAGLDGKSYPAKRDPKPKPQKSLDPRRAAKAVRMLSKVMASFERYCTALEELRLADQTVAGATPEDLANWERTAGETISVLTKLRRALRKANNVI